MNTWLTGLAAALALGSAAHAQLPDSVAAPYRAYQTAIEAGDEAAALDPAYRAWQAAEAARIDAETLGLLADNYAALASAAGQHGRAAEAFARSAEILEDTEGSTLLTAQTWRLAGRSAYSAGERGAAERHSDRALDILENLPASAENAAEQFLAETVRAYLDYEAGSMHSAGRHGEAAIGYLLNVNPVSNMDTANMAFFAGVKNAIATDHDEAAFYFSLSSYMYGNAGLDIDTRRTAEAWAYYSRTNIDADERIELVRRLDASGYRPPECDGDDGACSMFDSTPVDYPEGVEVVDAAPVRRREPQYPVEMLSAGLEGITLVRFAVGADGRPEDIEVLYSVPHSAFGEVSEDAVARWRYTPLTVDGVPTRREGVVTQFVFQLMP